MPLSDLPSDWRPRPAALAVSLGLCLLTLGGCAGYHMGHAGLYPPDIHTVYVPMIESDSFRRHLGERLTEAVVKQIELKTPFKVVHSPDADSVLVVRLVRDAKRIVVESPTDEQREMEHNFLAQVTWSSRRGPILQRSHEIPVGRLMNDVAQTANQLPEIGQTTATAQERALHRLAEQIVSMMEQPW